MRLKHETKTKFTLFSLLGIPSIQKKQLLGKEERPSLARHGGIRARCEHLNTTRQQTQEGERTINRSPGGPAGPFLGAQWAEEQRGHRHRPRGPGGQRGERGPARGWGREAGRGSPAGSGRREGGGAAGPAGPPAEGPPGAARSRGPGAGGAA